MGEVLNSNHKATEMKFSHRAIRETDESNEAAACRVHPPAQSVSFDVKTWISLGGFLLSVMITGMVVVNFFINSKLRERDMGPPPPTVARASELEVVRSDGVARGAQIDVVQDKLGALAGITTKLTDLQQKLLVEQSVLVTRVDALVTEVSKWKN
jgi:hypothetical protein